jgi:hypothetical protein
MMLRQRLLRLLLSDGMWFRYMMQGIWYLWINPSMPWKCFTVGHVASLLAVMPLLFRNKLPQNQEGQSQHRSRLTSYNLYQKKRLVEVLSTISDISVQLCAVQSG